jgi:two-component system LytT family response regulator
MERESNSGMRVLVVDDEAPARRLLADLLRQDHDVASVTEAEDGIAAVAVIENDRPDAVFLDVQMPGVDGFGVIEAVGADRMPSVIFVTAYDSYALKAFDTDAVDYLLKPFSNERFEHAMARLKAQRKVANALGPHVMELVGKRAAPGEIWDWLVIKGDETTRLVMASEIDWIEAAGNYVALHIPGKECLYRANLGAITKRLDPHRFVRIHRSSVVNIRSVVELIPISHGEFEVVMRDGARLVLSRNFRIELEKRLGQSL